MPWANTSGWRDLRAKSRSMCTWLWSPEAPAYSASVVRLTAGSTSGGSSSPTWTSLNCGMFILGSSALYGGRQHVGDMLAVLVGDTGFGDHELQRPALLLVH